jgi:hypothetical protein
MSKRKADDEAPAPGNPPPRIGVESYEILERRRDKRLTVPLALWEKIMSRLKPCDDDSQWYQSLGWCLLGLAGGALIAALGSLCSVDFIHLGPEKETVNVAAWIAQVVYICLFVCGLGGAYLSFKFAKTHHQDRMNLQAVIHEDMRQFRDEHLSSPTPR